MCFFGVALGVDSIVTISQSVSQKYCRYFNRWFLPQLKGVLSTSGDRLISELSTEGPENVGQSLPSAFASGFLN